MIRIVIKINNTAREFLREFIKACEDKKKIKTVWLRDILQSKYSDHAYENWNFTSLIFVDLSG